MKLTKRSIDAAIYSGTDNRRMVLWDDDVKGLGCRVYPSGRKAFVLSYRVNGRKRMMSLGNYGVMTLDQARKTARARLVETENGQDPLADKQRLNASDTMAQLCQTYLTRHAGQKKSGDEDERRLKLYVLPEWGNLKVEALTREDVAKLHGRLGKQINPKTGKPKIYEANRVLALVRSIFNKAKEWGLLADSHPNPAERIKSFSEEKRDRWVTPEELPALIKAIDEEPNESARLGLWLYILTGCRKSEILTAKWDDVDFNRQELRLPDTKAGRVHYVPLTQPVMELLQNAPRVQGNPYILPGKVMGQHLVNINKPWSRVRKASGLETVRLHDLRRTVGSWLAQAGNSLHLIGRVLNHSNASTTQIYARFGEDTVRTAMDRHAQHVMNVVRGESANESQT